MTDVAPPPALNMISRTQNPHTPAKAMVALAAAWPSVVRGMCVSSHHCLHTRIRARAHTPSSGCQNSKAKHWRLPHSLVSESCRQCHALAGTLEGDKGVCEVFPAGRPFGDWKLTVCVTDCQRGPEREGRMAMWWCLPSQHSGGCMAPGQSQARWHT